MIKPREMIQHLDERLDLAVRGIEHASDSGDREMLQYWMGQVHLLTHVRIIVEKLEKESSNETVQS